MSFEFRYTSAPWKQLFTLYTGISVLCKLPFWIGYALLQRPQSSWTFTQALAVNFFRLIMPFEGNVGFMPVPSIEEGVKSAKKWGVALVSVPPVPDTMVAGEILDAAKVNNVAPISVHGYWYGVPSPNEPLKDIKDVKVFYYIHGGGFIRSTAHPSDIITNGVINFLQKHCPGARTFSLEYRLCAAAPLNPQNPFPAALVDVLSGYHYLLHVVGVNPKNVIVCGDSAGANLALALCTYLARHSIASSFMPLPARMLLHSPAVDWGRSHSGPNTSMETNRASDFISIFADTDFVGRALRGKLHREELDTNFYISPASLLIPEVDGLFKSHPDVILIYGSAEILVDGIHTLRDRMIKDMGQHRVTDVEEAGAFHDFLAFSLFESQKSHAAERLKEWYNSI